MGERRLREYPVRPFRPLCRNIRESSLGAHAFVRMFVEPRNKGRAPATPRAHQGVCRGSPAKDLGDDQGDLP